MFKKKILFDPSPRIMKVKTKINKWDPIKLKSFSTTKETIHKMKRIANGATDKGLISKIYKHLMQHNIRKSNHSFKLGGRPKQTFLQRRHSIGQQTSEKVFKIAHYQKKKIKTTKKQFRMALMKKPTNKECWRGCSEKGTLLHCQWECKLIQPLWRTVWRFLRKLGIRLPYVPEIPLLCMCVCMLRHVGLLVTTWTIAHQAWLLYILGKP